MKTVYKMILVLTAVSVILLGTAVTCKADERGGKGGWSGDEQMQKHKRFELTDEKIDRMMNRLKETDPNKAQELAELRKEEPEKFKAELRDIMREQFAKRGKERKEQGGSRKPQGPRGAPVVEGRPGSPNEPFGARRRDTIRESLRDRGTDYLGWLEKNYPEEAERLIRLREDNPELYLQQLRFGNRKYRRIAEASKENPQLAEILKKGLELRNEQDKLLDKIRATTDENEKKELVAKLEKVISDRFDSIVQRKQIEYEQLSRHLEDLKKRVEQNKAKIAKLQETKSAKVAEHLKELLNQTENFNWE